MTMIWVEFSANEKDEALDGTENVKQGAECTVLALEQVTVGSGDWTGKKVCKNLESCGTKRVKVVMERGNACTSHWTKTSPRQDELVYGAAILIGDQPRLKVVLNLAGDDRSTGRGRLV